MAYIAELYWRAYREDGSAEETHDGNIIVRVHEMDDHVYHVMDQLEEELRKNRFQNDTGWEIDIEILDYFKDDGNRFVKIDRDFTR